MAQRIQSLLLSRRPVRIVLAFVGLGLVSQFAACDRYYPPSAVPLEIDIEAERQSGDKLTAGDEIDIDNVPGTSGSGREHQGDHGSNGSIASLANDQYHAEVIIDSSGKVHLFTFGRDVSTAILVPRQDLIAYYRLDDSAESSASVLRPIANPDAMEEFVYQFEGDLPESFVGKSYTITIPGLSFPEGRFTARFKISAAPIVSVSMPSEVIGDRAADIFLTPAGKYTQDDIIANGYMTASEKYRGFVATHDPNPQPGDFICPITLTKGNPKCTWIVGGQRYQFCCPPCISEFILSAKNSPEKIKNSDAYIVPAAKSREPK